MMSSSEEPQNEWPESLPQQLHRLRAAAEDPLIRMRVALRRHRRLLAPVIVVTSYVLFSLVCHEIGDLFRFSETVVLAVLGAMLSGQIACGCWAVWAPFSVIWRLPSALAAAVVLALVQPQPNHGAECFFLIIHAAIFAGYFTMFGLARRLTGWRLTVGQRQEEPRKQQFNLRYLFLLTALVAGVMTLGRLLVGDMGPIEAGGASTREIVGTFLVMAGGFTLLQAPAAAGFLALLFPRLRWPVLLLVLPLLIAVTSYATVQVFVSTIPVGQPINELWQVTAVMAAGATSAIIIAATTLRLGGYRLTGGKATDA